MQSKGVADNETAPKLAHAQSNAVAASSNEFGQLNHIQKISSQDNRPLTAVQKVKSSTQEWESQTSRLKALKNKRTSAFK